MSKTSNIIGRMASARESAFFKVEQEADLQRHSRRLVRDGKIQDVAGRRLGGKVSTASRTDSSRHFEVLAEILQQKARVHDPHAASRQEFVRRVKGVPSRLSAEEVARWRSSRAGVMAMVGHVPRLALGGRDRYGLAAAAAAEMATAAHTPMSPDAIEVARRTQTAGMRALLYGTVLAVAGVAVGTTLGARALDVRSAQDVRGAVQGASQPLVLALRRRMEPLKGWTQDLIGLDPDSVEGPRSQPRAPQTELSQRLGARWNPRNTGTHSF